MKDDLTKRYERPDTFTKLLRMKPLGDASAGVLGAAWRAALERWMGGREPLDRTKGRRAQKATALVLKMRRRHVLKAEKRARRRAENIAKLAAAFNGAVFRDSAFGAMVTRTP